MCSFDELEHSAIWERVRRRIADKRVLALIKAFLKAGIMTEHGDLEAQLTGTPQGGIADGSHASANFEFERSFRRSARRSRP